MQVPVLHCFTQWLVNNYSSQKKSQNWIKLKNKTYIHFCTNNTESCICYNSNISMIQNLLWISFTKTLTITGTITDKVTTFRSSQLGVVLRTFKWGRVWPGPIMLTSMFKQQQPLEFGYQLIIGREFYKSVAFWAK